MAYVGQGIKGGTFSVLDTSGNTYNGSNTTFNLGTQVGSPAQLLVSHDGVIQKPVTDYVLATGGTQITFTTAPASGASIFITEISGAVGAPMNRDINGDELILDADADTSITADTDDQIDVRIGGSDRFKLDNSGHLSLLTDSGAIKFGADSDVTLTHVADTGLTFKTAATASDSYPTLNIHTGSTDIDDNDYIGRIDFRAPDEGTGTDAITAAAAIYARAEADFSSSVNKTKLVFQTGSSGAASDKLTITNNGSISLTPEADATWVWNENSVDADFRIESNGNANMIVVDGGSDFVAIGKNNGTTSNVGNYFSPTSENHFTVGAATVAIFNREDNGSGQNFDGAVVAFRANNSEQGTISISGSTTSYNAFSGAHWGRLSDNSAPTILRGTVIESIATMIDWYVIKMTNSDDYEFHEEIALPNGKSAGDTISHTAKDGVTYNGVIEKQMNEQLPMTKISDTADSKAVYGVFNSWDNEPDDGINDMLVTALGAFIVRVHKDETLAIGDLLSSKGDGTAKKQADDIFRDSTIAKVTSTTKIETYSDGSYCVPCTLHCG